MICAELFREENGALAACRVSGHAGFAEKGSDIVCAAASVLVRTAASALSKADGIECRVEAPVRGQLMFRIKKSAAGKSERLAYALDFLQAGFESLAAEYPECVTVRIITEI